ncbi:NACHT and WD repeat domain-containing protein 2 [Nephila pilipes]|uniref:NACHT and WD repeat domain-containing protein 2 n=1 Tax=Nephila pilipes TaxID=299642 RepID=A0A8X6PQ31_NEPPI|nr:NACHT and WD repeat domain-containing protein 2 [Nephila pilipes]
MGTGCSSVENVRSKIRRNIALQSRRSQKGNLKGALKSEEETESREEDDELAALSPISDTTKVGSGGTRGLSAASTVLPGTSISFSPVLEELSEFESFKPLPDLDEFPEDVRHLLLGHCSTNDPNANLRLKDVYLLVLANGTEGLRFFEELKRVLIPSLKTFSFENETTLHVYLFGHQPVLCGRDYRFLIVNFIREMLRNETVITITIFGRPEVYIQPPDIIQQSDFDVAVSRMSSIDSRETIHCLYSADVNAAKTCYRLQEQPADSQDWDQQSQTILHILETAFKDDQKRIYITSVFEDILRLFNGAHDATLESRSFLIHLESSSGVEDKPSRESSRVQHLLAEWENKIPDDFKFNFFDGDSWEELWNGDAPTQETNQEGAFASLGSRLKQLLSSVFEKYEKEKKYFAKFAGKGVSWQLRNELLHQQTEIRNHLQTFRDRPDLLSSLMNYITGPHNHPLVIRGRQGRGKSALLAVASVLCGAVFPTMPVLFRSAGVSPESFTQEQILRSICEQLATLYGEHPSVASRSIAEHNSYFVNLLKRASPERPMVILLDGLDQVEEYSGRSLKWFPAVLPQHVKLVLALRDGSSELQELQERLPEDGSTFLEIPDLEVEESLCIIEHLLQIRGRRLTDTQLGFVRICVTDNSYPRYAHVFAHVACTWHTLAIPERFWIRHSVYDIFCDYINEISKTINNSKVKKFLASLATLKHGMTESEIFQVLQSPLEQAGADSDCPLSYIYLKHHLSIIFRTSYRRGHKFTHYKGQLLRKLCKTYLGKEYLEECLNSTLKYIDNDEGNDLANNKMVKSVIKTNHKHQRWRELEEMTHLQIKLNVSVRKHFFNHQWLFERVTSGDVYLLLEEIKMYKRRNPDDREIDILRKFLQLSAYALRIDGKQLYTQFYGRSKGYFADPESNIKYPKVKKLIRSSITPPVPSFHTSGPCMRTLLDAQKLFPPSSKNKDSLDRMSWLDSGSTYLVTYSSSKGEIVGWNVNQTKQMVTFKEEECVVGLKTLGINAEVLVLHHNQMDVVDLTKNIVKTRMKELIDVSQGVSVLDGGKSILAISEGHDEILRFDTCSGHVANRIFAGEERYMNASLYTGN